MFGNLDASIVGSECLKFCKNTPKTDLPLKYTESLFANQPQGLLILISDSENQRLTAITAALLL